MACHPVTSPAKDWEVKRGPVDLKRRKLKKALKKNSEGKDTD